jgi:hypothetical protein
LAGAAAGSGFAGSASGFAGAAEGGGGTGTDGFTACSPVAGFVWTGPDFEGAAGENRYWLRRRTMPTSTNASSIRFSTEISGGLEGEGFGLSGSGIEMF